MTDAARRLSTVVEVLDAALARENEAHEFYKDALKRAAGNRDVSRLLEELADAEYKHAVLIQKKLAELRSR